MLNNEVIEGSGCGQGRSSDETLVARPNAGPLPKKQGEIGWVPQDKGADHQPAPQTSDDQLPPRHPADRTTPIPPTSPAAIATSPPNTSTSSVRSRSSALKQFLRTPRPLPTIHGVQSATILRLVFITLMLVGSIIGWAVSISHMNRWATQDSTNTPSSTSSGNSTTTLSPAPSTSTDKMAQSSILFVHITFGAAILFQLFVLERSVYRFRAERYAFLHPEEMTTASDTAPTMSLAPWNRPPLPTYAAALGIRGTGDVEDNMIAGPPPPEYGNTRGSTLLLASHLPSNRNASSSRPTSQHTIRDALGRPTEAWSRPVSYAQDEMMENARRSMVLETALARLEGSNVNATAGTGVTRPEVAVVRR